METDVRPPHVTYKLYHRIVFPIDTVRALRPHAKRRKISVAELACRIVERAGSDDLVDAILDD